MNKLTINLCDSKVKSKYWIINSKCSEVFAPRFKVIISFKIQLIQFNHSLLLNMYIYIIPNDLAENNKLIEK